MKLVLMHLDDGPDGGPEEEVTLLVPGGERVAVMVPLGAMDAVCAIYSEALAELPPQLCSSCGDRLAVEGAWA